MIIPHSHMKERLNMAYIEAVSARAGIKLHGRGVTEYGIDGYFQRLREWRTGKFKETGPQIQFQAKSTWDYGFQGDLVWYDMKTEAYDKLVDIIEDDDPTILILFCMPGENEIREWLLNNEEALTLKRCCYWDHIVGEPTNKENSTKRIKIPRNQILTPNAIHRMFDNLKEYGTL